MSTTTTVQIRPHGHKIQEFLDSKSQTKDHKKQQRKRLRNKARKTKLQPSSKFLLQPCFDPYAATPYIHSLLLRNHDVESTCLTVLYFLMISVALRLHWVNLQQAQTTSLQLTLEGVASRAALLGMMCRCICSSDYWIRLSPWEIHKMIQLWQCLQGGNRHLRMSTLPLIETPNKAFAAVSCTPSFTLLGIYLVQIRNTTTRWRRVYHSQGSKKR